MYLYILVNNKTGTYYIGITKDPIKRLVEHNKTNKHYTGKVHGEWVLLFLRKFETKLEARKEEIRLKKAKNKHYINWYIKEYTGQ